MTSDRMMRSHLAQAKYRLAEVERARRDGQYAVAVGRSQEAVELALKAALRAAGVEPPRWHDVGDVLRTNAARLPSALRTSLTRLAQISADLRQDREADPILPGRDATQARPSSGNPSIRAVSLSRASYAQKETSSITWRLR